MLTAGTPYTVDYSFGALSPSDAGQYTCVAVLVNNATNAALSINRTMEVTGTCRHTFRKYSYVHHVTCLHILFDA